jgi:hypothetical protein
MKGSTVRVRASGWPRCTWHRAGVSFRGPAFGKRCGENPNEHVRRAHPASPSVPPALVGNALLEGGDEARGHLDGATIPTEHCIRDPVEKGEERFLCREMTFHQVICDDAEPLEHWRARVCLIHARYRGSRSQTRPPSSVSNCTWSSQRARRSTSSWRRAGWVVQDDSELDPWVLTQPTCRRSRATSVGGELRNGVALCMSPPPRNKRPLRA